MRCEEWEKKQKATLTSKRENNKKNNKQLF